jgi:hypothetical protein
MGRIVLKTVEEFQGNVFKQSDNQILVSFTGITNYDELRAKLTVQAMKEVKIYDSETSFLAYENFTKFINPSKIIEVGDGTIEVVIIFEREDETVLKLNELIERQTLVEDALNELILG